MFYSYTGWGKGSRRSLPVEGDEALTRTHFLRVHDSFAVSLFDVDKFYAGALYMGKLYFPVGRRFHPGIIAALNLVRRSIKDVLSENNWIIDGHDKLEN